MHLHIAVSKTGAQCLLQLQELQQQYKDLHAQLAAQQQKGKSTKVALSEQQSKTRAAEDSLVDLEQTLKSLGQSQADVSSPHQQGVQVTLLLLCKCF